MDLLIVGGTVVELILARVLRLPTWPDHTTFTTNNFVLLSEAPIVTLGGNGTNAVVSSPRGRVGARESE